MKSLKKLEELLINVDYKKFLRKFVYKKSFWLIIIAWLTKKWKLQFSINFYYIFSQVSKSLFYLNLIDSFITSASDLIISADTTLAIITLFSRQSIYTCKSHCNILLKINLPISVVYSVATQTTKTLENFRWTKSCSDAIVTPKN